ncbi:MAG: M13 family metallopeptidase [Tidjanibacter sp.]|nr:M13 family metallopeptidase [Tidjanibacter sp.]MBR4064979.1 M13 family metallopeptidase [Tidjanibacter sp.]
MKKCMIIAFALAALAGCKSQSTSVPGIDLTNLDTNIAIQDDFYQYATGGWQAKNPLKPEYSRYGSFDVLREQNEIRLNDLFSAMATSKAEAGSVEQKISDLYKLGLDSVRLNAEGAEPIMSYVENILAIDSREEVLAEIYRMHASNGSPFFGVGVDADMMDSRNNVMYIQQGGLTMGERDYYIDPANKHIREAYKQYLATIFHLIGMEEADALRAIDADLRVEDALAEAAWSNVELRDVARSYNPMSMSDFKVKYSVIDWDKYFAGMGAGKFDKIILGQPSALDATMELIASAPVEDLKYYLLAHLVDGAASSLSDDFVTASFEFYERTLSGQQEQRPRWKRAMAVPNSLLSEAVGEMYVAKYFAEEDKERMLEMVGNLQTALGQHIAALDWMGDQTKAKAQEKLANFTVKIGYPDKWKDYSELQVDPTLSYYENRKRASEWYTRDNMAKVGKPVDRDQWFMSPQTVNAYYNPTTNEICFPAAILQPPFYNPNADDAVNYGAIGVVIGHEMTHGFDDQGRMFDKDGNMSNWWTDEDAAAFKAKTDVLVEQFNAIEVLPGVFADGALSLGENIADQGGLRVAYTAYKNSLEGKEEPADIDGFTDDQRFYLGYAALWGQNITDQAIARLTKEDVHSLGRNRVNATLMNVDDFYKAFGITEGKMFRPESERVVIW